MTRRLENGVDLCGPLQLAGAAGTSGQVLTSAGTGAVPTWTTPSGGGGSSLSYTTTATSKTLSNNEICTVTASSQTITLPASPSTGWQAGVSVAGTFTDTIIARNGSNIMSLAENMTVDKAYISLTLIYIDATRGWRIF
jgi:hypothetical protein